MGYGNQSSGSARLNKAIASYWNEWVTSVARADR